MDQTHLHLLITHLPIFGTLLGGVVLGYGLFVNSEQTKYAAYILLIISALGAGVAYVTGEAAEETVENIQGVAESVIKTHENAALYSLMGIIVLGILSIAAIFITKRKHVNEDLVSKATLFLAIVCFGLVARTGYLGGKIRHSEINGGASTQTIEEGKAGAEVEAGESGDKDDDD